MRLEDYEVGMEQKMNVEEQIVNVNEQNENLEEQKVATEEQRMRFEDADIDSGILKAVKEMGFETMSPIQEKAIPFLLEGRDIIGQAQDGGLWYSHDSEYGS